MVGVKFLSDLPFPLTRKKNHEDGVASCKYPFDMLVLPEDWDFAETKFEAFMSRIDSSHQKISYLCSFTFLSLLDPTFLHHTDQSVVPPLVRTDNSLSLMLHIREHIWTFVWTRCSGKGGSRRQERLHVSGLAGTVVHY